MKLSDTGEYSAVDVLLPTGKTKLPAAENSFFKPPVPVAMIMAVDEGVPLIAAAGPNDIMLDPRETSPLVSFKVPLIPRSLVILIPLLLETSMVEFVLAVITPVPEIVCVADPFNLTVPVEAGLKFKVPVAATWMFPLMEWPGVPVMLILRVPLVILRLSIETADPPDVEGA